jgi:hypothetical protein
MRKKTQFRSNQCDRNKVVNEKQYKRQSIDIGGKGEAQSKAVEGTV